MELKTLIWLEGWKVGDLSVLPTFPFFILIRRLGGAAFQPSILQFKRGEVPSHKQGYHQGCQ